MGRNKKQRRNKCTNTNDSVPPHRFAVPSWCQSCASQWCVKKINRGEEYGCVLRERMVLRVQRNKNKDAAMHEHNDSGQHAYRLRSSSLLQSCASRWFVEKGNQGEEILIRSSSIYSSEKTMFLQVRTTNRRQAAILWQSVRRMVGAHVPGGPPGRGRV